MKDVEILLRGFSMLVDGENYKPSMTKFLNKFSFMAKSYPQENIDYLENLFQAFIEKASEADPKLFHSKTGRFNISVYESVFVAACSNAFRNKTLNVSDIDADKAVTLKENQEFINATQSETASTKNVTLRIRKAKEILN